MKTNYRVDAEGLLPAIESLEGYFKDGGASIVQAAFQHTYFVHPDAVLNNTPLLPNRARRSREHYPRIDKDQTTTWKAGDGREIILDDNSRAPMAWERYTGSKLARRSVYGVRHIWGTQPRRIHRRVEPMLHALLGWNADGRPASAPPKLQAAIRQASWNLYFSSHPVCEIPDFVTSPDIDLTVLLDGSPLKVLRQNPKGAVPETTQQKHLGAKGRGLTLPITLDPPNSGDFLGLLVRMKKAWIQVTYQDGHSEVQLWNAGNMRPTSNVIGNLRSRPEFRSNAWQNNGIDSIRVTIGEPSSDGNINPPVEGPTGWRKPLSQFVGGGGTTIQ